MECAGVVKTGTWPPSSRGSTPSSSSTDHPPRATRAVSFDVRFEVYVPSDRFGYVIVSNAHHVAYPLDPVEPTMASGSAQAEILLVEDNPGDVRLIEETFRDGSVDNTLHTVTDGETALAFIHRDGEYEGAPRPDLVLLDLNLPRVDGEDVLREIKHHPELETVPVVILTGADSEYVESSDLDHDSDEDAVIEKPIEIDDLVDVIREFDGFRISFVRTEDA